MTDTLKDRIVRHIEMSGPLPLAEYMHWCLFDKTQGYYTTNNVIGRSGDFVTAPEISQMFGELIGVFLIQAWRDLGQPDPFNLIELGPGNGTLMKDIARAGAKEPGFIKAARIQMIETSDALVQIQRNTLQGVKHINWHKSLDDVSNSVSLVVTNEFLDALPFRQYIKSETSWLERCVTIDAERNLEWCLGAGRLEEQALPEAHALEPAGSVFEISTVRESFIECVSTRIQKSGGAALFIDYGHVQSAFGDTFQAISSHKYADPLETPGDSDLTSHVDFEPLTKLVATSGCNIMPVVTQGEFLLNSGLLERAGSLGSGKTKTEQDRIKKEAERLALPDEMGNLFKVMAFSSGPELRPFHKTS